MDRVELFEKEAHKIALLADIFDKKVINDSDNPLELLVKTAAYTLQEMDKFLLISIITDEEMLKYLNETAKLAQLGMLGHQYTLGGKVDCESLAKQMADTYRKKNADYGDSVHDTYVKYGLTSFLVRLEDKLNRARTLSKQTARVADEKIEDTLLDMANYAILAVIELHADKEKELSSTNE